MGFKGHSKVVLPELIVTGNDAILLENTVWEDRRFPLTRDRQGVAQKPDYDFTNMGLLFPQNDTSEIVYLTIQMPHRMKLESVIRPHIHYVQDEATEPVFKIDYRWYKNGETPLGAFTTITLDTFIFTYVASPILQILAGPDISGTGIDTVSSMLDIKLYRDDNIVTGDVLGKEFDLHYQIDTMGSRDEFVK